MRSVTQWSPTDPQALAELLELHAVARPRILDGTYGRGLVWGRLPIRREVVNPDLPGLDLVASAVAARLTAYRPGPEVRRR